MAKLFATIDSDRASKHQIANRFLNIKIFYGSREKPKLLTHIVVRHDPNSDKPRLNIDSNVEFEVLHIREP